MNKKLLLLLIVIVLIVVGLWYSVANFYFKVYLEAENAGIIGDSYGGVTSLFSALAFAGIIFTFIVQFQELQLLRKDSNNSTKAHNEIAKLQALSVEAFAYTELSQYARKRAASSPLSKEEEFFESKLQETIQSIDELQSKANNDGKV